MSGAATHWMDIHSRNLSVDQQYELAKLLASNCGYKLVIDDNSNLNLIVAISMAKEILAMVEFLDRIKAALGTEETGDALIEVARNAHKAEMELAAIKRNQNEP